MGKTFATTQADYSYALPFVSCKRDLIYYMMKEHSTGRANTAVDASPDAYSSRLRYYIYVMPPWQEYPARFTILINIYHVLLVYCND